MRTTRFASLQDGQAIDKGRPLVPVVGQVYTNRGGGEYRCMRSLAKHDIENN